MLRLPDQDRRHLGHMETNIKSKVTHDNLVTTLKPAHLQVILVGGEEGERLKQARPVHARTGHQLLADGGGVGKLLHHDG